MKRRLSRGNGFLRQSHSLDCAVPVRTTALDSVGVNARRIFGCKLAQSALFAAIEVNVFDVKGVDVTWNIPKNGEADVDEQISTAAGDHEYADGREEDCDENDEEGGRCVGHCALFVVVC